MLPYREFIKEPGDLITDIESFTYLALERFLGSLWTFSTPSRPRCSPFDTLQQRCDNKHCPG
jgi:hypothetical protein